MVEDIIAGMFGVGAAAFVGAFLIGAILIGIAIYVYTALALMKIADKYNHPYPWVAWIPIANMALLLQLGGFHWAWIFLIVIPYIGAFVLAILTVVALFKITEKIGVVPAWTAILTIIPFFGNIWMLVLLGLLAWKD